MKRSLILLAVTTGFFMAVQQLHRKPEEMNQYVFPHAKLVEQTSSPTVPTGLGFLYFKSDGFLYVKNDAGEEIQMTKAGGINAGAAAGLEFQFSPNQFYLSDQALLVDEDFERIIKFPQASTGYVYTPWLRLPEAWADQASLNNRLTLEVGVGLDGSGIVPWEVVAQYWVNQSVSYSNGGTQNYPALAAANVQGATVVKNPVDLDPGNYEVLIHFGAGSLLPTTQSGATLSLNVSSFAPDSAPPDEQVVRIQGYVATDESWPPNSGELNEGGTGNGYRTAAAIDYPVTSSGVKTIDISSIISEMISSGSNQFWLILTNLHGSYDDVEINTTGTVIQINVLSEPMKIQGPQKLIWEDSVGYKSQGDTLVPKETEFVFQSVDNPKNWFALTWLWTPGEEDTPFEFATKTWVRFRLSRKQINIAAVKLHYARIYLGGDIGYGYGGYS